LEKERKRLPAIESFIMGAVLHRSAAPKKNLSFVAATREKSSLVARLMMTRNVRQAEWANKALENACFWGSIDIVRLLLDYGVDVNWDNGAALDEASRQGYIDIVRLLLERGTSMISPNDGVPTPMLLACLYGCANVVALFLDMGADIHYDGDYALWMAAKHGRVFVVRLLLDRGANVRARWCRAFKDACSGGHLRVVEMLLKANIGEDDVKAVLRQPDLQDNIRQLLEENVGKLGPVKCCFVCTRRQVNRVGVQQYMLTS
ncbi:hypothetical protein HDU93_008284, partial [Gonapodya sp. JEL0774]